MSTEERDQQIAEQYRRGRPASRIAKDIGLSVSQVRKILSDNKVTKDPALAKRSPPEDKVIDENHRKLGNRLYAFRFAQLKDTRQASKILGWSVRKLRGIEQGHSPIDLSDLKAMAEYMKTSISDLTRNL